MSRLLISEALQDYAERMTSAEPGPLAALNRETHLKVTAPQMLSGHLQGALLTMISQMLRPRRILEIGTYTGYSALCLARGLAPEGILHTIDINEELGWMHRKYAEEEGLQERIRFHYGNALDLVPTLDETWDLVFLDADKAAYGAYYDLVLPRLRPGGILVADNVLYEGDVLLPPERQGRLARAVDAFNRKIAADPAVSQVLLPVRDGLLIIRKTGD